MVDNSFVPRPLSPRTAKQKREELERKMQQSQSARNNERSTLGSGGIFDVDGSLRLRNKGELLITDEGEAKVIGEGQDFFTKQPTTVQACLANRRAYNSWIGYEYLQPGLYFSTTETRGALDARLTSRDGKSLSMVSAVELLENSPQVGPNIMSKSAITVDKYGTILSASSWDDAVNPGGGDGTAGNKGNSFAYFTPSSIQMGLADYESGNTVGSIGVSLDDPVLRMGGKDGTDVKGPLTVDGQPVTGGGGDWATITNKPATFPPSSHTHAIADVANLQATLNGKAATTHNHSAADINSGTLDVARIPLATTSTAGAITAADKATLNAVPAIASGKLFISGPVAAGGVSGTVAVTFPTGMFTGAPNMTFGTNDPRVSPNIIGLSAGGCSIRAFNYTNAATTASPTVWWIAINA